MVTHLGTFLGTELGTDLGTFQDGSITFDASKLYAIGNLSNANYFVTPAGGGEVGDTAGFGLFASFVVTNLPSGDQCIVDSSGPGSTGYALQIRSTGELRVVTFNGAGTLTLPTGYFVSTSSLGRILNATLQISGTLIQLRVSGIQAANSAIVGYTPRGAAGAQTLGRASGQGFTAGTLLAHATFRGTPSTAQVAAAESAIRTLGDVPSKAAIEAVMPGTVVTHRWSLRDTLAAANVPVVDGQAAPATIPDSVTAAGVDAMAKVGSPVVRVIDPTTPRLWSYETSPILYGASGFTQTNFYASGVWNEPAAAPWWTAALFTVVSQSVASGNRTILGNGEIVVSNYTGFHLCTAGTNSLCYINLCNAAGVFVSGPVGSIAASDVGKLLLYVGVWDPVAGKIRGYWKRAEIGTGSVLATYLPSPSTPLRLGRSISNADWSAGSIVAYGVSGGFGLPTLAQVQALFDDTQATERIGSIAGMTSFRVDLTQDALGNGGVVPATLTDRVGSFNFTRTGTVSTTPQYSRAWNW